MISSWLLGDKALVKHSTCKYINKLNHNGHAMHVHDIPGGRGLLMAIKQYL